MFDSLNDQALRVAHDAARVLYDNHRALGLDVLAVKLDTLRVDLAVELENRGKPLAPADERPAPPADARQAPARDQPAHLELRRSTIVMTSASPRPGTTAARRPTHASAQETCRCGCWGRKDRPSACPSGSPARHPGQRRCGGSLRP